MTKEQTPSPINLPMLLIVSLLGGGIAGFFAGEQSSNRPPTAVTGVLPVNLNDIIPIEFTSIVEGLSCPSPGCTNTLLNCQGELARRLRGWVNTQIAAGRPAEEITAGIIKTHGPQVFKIPGVNTP